MSGIDELLQRAGLTPAPAVRLSGGDMGEVWRVGEHVVKTHPSPPVGLFEAEANGLKALAKAGIRTPAVYHADETGLVMDWLPPGPDDPEGLAENLARMHSMKGETYGWEHPVFLGRFPVSPGATGTSGPDFWRDHRIDPLLRATWSALGGLGPRVENLLRQYSPSTEGPTLLHGDLWNGNVVMARGGATLIDPSVWWGERAVDLAMMQLFGGFSQRFWSHYDSLLPMGPSVHETIPFYQLYFLLVHVHFFGRGYCSGVERILDTYGV